MAMRAPTPARMSAALATYAREVQARAEAVARLAALLAVLEAAALPAASPGLGTARSVQNAYDLWSTDLARCLCNEAAADADALSSGWYKQLASVWRTAVYDDDATTEVCTEVVVAALLPLVPAPENARAMRKRCRDDRWPLMRHIVAALDMATSALSTVP